MGSKKGFGIDETELSIPFNKLNQRRAIKNEGMYHTACHLLSFHIPTLKKKKPHGKKEGI